MTDIRAEIKNELLQAIASAGFTIPDGATVAITKPPFLHQGDYTTNIALVLAKQAGKKPVDVAQEIIAHFGKGNSIEKIESTPQGFINVILSATFFEQGLKELVDVSEKNGKLVFGVFGDVSTDYKGKKFVVEHTSANPNKAMHLGHLRNNVIGMAISNLFEIVGATVVRDYVNNNRGIAIAKLMWGYLKFARRDGQQDKTNIDYWYNHQSEWIGLEDFGKRPDVFVDELYVRASEDCKNNPESEAVVRQMVIDWEAEDSKNRSLWTQVLSYVYISQKRTLDRLGSKIDTSWDESEHYKEGKDIIVRGLGRGIFKQLEDGAILTNLESFGLTDTIVQKKDGTALYITQDLALTRLKKQTYNPDMLYWVIGVDQSLAMQQLFAVCEQLGIITRDHCTHISYGLLNLRNEAGQAVKMSSRSGNTVYIDDLIDLVKVAVKEKIKSQETLHDEELEALAESIALGAVKFSILKVSRNSNIVFDISSSIDIQGDSGPYVQYAHARCSAILRKAKEQSIVPMIQTGIEDVSELERLLFQFGEVVQIAAQHLEPQAVCTYLLKLAQGFNSYYATHKVLDDGNPKLSAHRLGVVVATATVLRTGLELLGISAPNRM